MHHLDRFVAAAVIVLGAQHGAAQSLEGHIADWPPGQTGQLLVVLDTSGAPAARADITGDGGFRVVFPPLKAMAQLPGIRTFQNAYQTTTLFCPQATSSARGASLTGIQFSVAHLAASRSGGEPLGQLDLRSPAASDVRAGLGSAVLLFLSRPVKLHGTVRCPDQEVQLDLDLPAGFTLLAREILKVNHGVVVSRFTRTPPAPRAWYLGADWTRLAGTPEITAPASR